MEHFTEAEKARFWKKVQKGPDCWNWTGARQQRGYGVMMLDGKPRAAHRISYAMHNPSFSVREKCDVAKAMTERVYVLHSCDNPSCVNPDHLRAGTVVENLDEKVRKGRHTRGESHPAAKLTEEDVRYIRSLPDTREAMLEASARLGVCKGTIVDAYRKATWRQIV